MGRLLKILLLLSVGLLMASVTALSFILIIRGRVGEAAIAALPPPEVSGSAQVRETSLRVVLLRSEATQRHFSENAGGDTGSYGRRVAEWRRWFEGRDVRVVVVGEHELAAGSFAGPTVIVAPSAAALPDATVEAVRSAVEGGAGLIATWAYGLYHADGSWRGYGALEALAGVRAIEHPGRLPADPPRYVALHDATAPTAGLPAGGRMEFQPFDHPLALAGPTAIADYVTWTMLPLGQAGLPVYPTAVARAQYGAGRVVWMNFEPMAHVGGGESAQWLDHLRSNALAWTGNAPLGEVASWPNGARMAATIGLDAEHSFEKAADIAQRMREIGLPFTSFTLSSLASSHREVTRALGRVAEIASHTHDHRPLTELDEAGQRWEFTQSRAVLTDLTGASIVGLRPPQERTNDETIPALVSAGYQYVVGWERKDRAEPWVMEHAGKAVVVMPRIPNDDFQYTVRQPLENPGLAWEVMRNDVFHLRRLGGYYFFDFHTQYWDDPAIRTGVQHLTGLRNLAGVWYATSGEVASWWRIRSRSAVRIERESDGGIRVALASGLATPSLSVVVFLPEGFERVDVSGVEGPRPEVDLRGGVDRALYLTFHDIAENETRVARITTPTT